MIVKRLEFTAGQKKTVLRERHVSGVPRIRVISRFYDVFQEKSCQYCKKKKMNSYILIYLKLFPSND